MNLLSMMGIDDNFFDDFKNLMTEYTERQKRIEEKLDKLLESVEKKTEDKEHE